MRDYPEIVYKYRSWKDEYNRKTLTNFELYLSSPSDFNDPFDCQIPMNYHLLTNDEIIVYAEKLVERHKVEILRRGLKLRYEKKSLIKTLQNERENFQTKSEKTEFKFYNNNVGVLSLSKNWDNVLMWSHYGDNHKGYCIGFLEEPLSKTNGFGSGGMVMYPKSEEYPEIHPLEENSMVNHFKNTHNKAKDWQYEDEYRLTKIYMQQPSLLDRIVKYDPKIISEVLIGITTPEKDRKEIIQFCSKNGIKVFQCFKVPFKFKIERKEIKART